MNRILPRLTALAFVGSTLLLSGCAVPPPLKTVGGGLTSAKYLVTGTRQPVETFEKADIVEYYLDVRWDNPALAGGTHTVTFNWYIDATLVSTTTKRLTFKTTPHELHTRRAASALGTGHGEVEILIDGNVFGSKEFTVRP